MNHSWIKNLNLLQEYVVRCRLCNRFYKPDEQYSNCPHEPRRSDTMFEYSDLDPRSKNRGKYE